MADPHPSHPPGLTSTERRIVELIREGKPDAEIAVRVGLSTGEVKARIERIAAKAGVNGRGGLANANGRGPAEPESVIGGDEPVIGATTQPLARAPAVSRIPDGLAIRLAAFVALAAVAALVGWLFFDGADGNAGPGEAPEGAKRGVAESSDDEEPFGQSNVYTILSATPARPAETATPFPTPAPGPIIAGGIETAQFIVGPPVPFPDGMMLVASGCPFCEIQVDSILRLFKRKDGTVSAVTLFSTQVQGDVGDPRYISSYGASPGGNRIVVAICVPSTCPGFETANDAAEIELRESTDGGLSWAEIGSVKGHVTIAGVSDSEIVIRQSPPQLAGEAVPFVAFPSLEPWNGPGQDTLVSVFPLANGKWATARDGYLAVGARQLDWFESSFRVTAVTPGAHGGYYVAWRDERMTPEKSFVGFVGDGPQLLVAHWVVADELRLGPLVDGGQADTSRLLGNLVNGGITQVVLIEPTGIIWPIEGPWGVSRSIKILAFQAGAFVEVNTPDDCLNVRAEPTEEAPVIECLPHRTLLQRPPRPASEPEGWLAVATTTGQNGWVGAAHVIE